MNNDNGILNLLSKNRDSDTVIPYTATQLADIFGIDEREVRKSISRLRREHSIINLQDKRGYRLENGEDEDGQALIRRWIVQETSRAIACYAHLKGAKSKLKDPNQMMIDLHKAVDDAFNQAESEGTK
jgi:biotin operon repressor